MLCDSCQTPITLRDPITPEMCKPDLHQQVRLIYFCDGCLHEQEYVLIVPVVVDKNLKNALREVERALRWKATRRNAIVDFDDRKGCFVSIADLNSSTKMFKEIFRVNLLRAYVRLQTLGALDILDENPIKLELSVLGYILTVHNP